MGKLYDKYLKEYAEKLIKGGEIAIKNAMNRKKYTHRTFNLHDSYGSCLYVNGKEYPNSRRFLDKQATNGKYDHSEWVVYGRQEIERFFDTYKADQNKIQLVTAAAIYYASELGARWKVFSGAYTEMEKLSKEFGGFLTKIHTEQ